MPDEPTIEELEDLLIEEFENEIASIGALEGDATYAD